MFEHINIQIIFKAIRVNDITLEMSVDREGKRSKNPTSVNLNGNMKRINNGS